VASRVARMSGGVAVNPESVQLSRDLPRLAACRGRLGVAFSFSACSGVFSPRDTQ
jgi:hypothetical protein